MMSGIYIQILIALVTAHLVGDFVIQSREVSENKHKWRVLLFHTLIIAGLSWLLCGLWSSWLIPAGVFVIHTLLDYIKSRYLRNTLSTFLIDQLLHILSLVVLALFVSHISMGTIPAWSNLVGKEYWMFLVMASGFTAAVRMSGFIIQYAVSPFPDALNSENQSDHHDPYKGLPNGGLWIGNLERALIMLLYLSGQGVGIGFLIAAKSILRYGEIKSDDDKMRAEYIIIGTLMSFCLGIFWAVLTGYIMARV